MTDPSRTGAQLDIFGYEKNGVGFAPFDFLELQA